MNEEMQLYAKHDGEKRAIIKKNDCGVPFFPNTPKKKNKLVEGFFVVEKPTVVLEAGSQQ